MNHAASHAAAENQPSLIGFLISSVFHMSLILLMALAVSDMHRGTSTSGDANGIVLRMESAPGDAFSGEDGPGESIDTIELTPPQELLSSELDDPAPADIQLEFSPNTIVEPTPPAAPQNVAAALPSPPQPTLASSARTPQSANLVATPPGRAGLPAGRGYAHVRVFGVEGRGNKFVYVFDRSASMEGAPLAAAKRQLVESLGSLASIHQFHIIFFNHRLQSFDMSGGGQRVTFGTDRNKQLAANFVGGITADGGTDRYLALKAALGFRPDVIFFLTDADDPMSRSELNDIEAASQRTGTSIAVIEFGRQPAPAADNFLQALARATGGQYGYVNTIRLTAPSR